MTGALILLEACWRATDYAPARIWNDIWIYGVYTSRFYIEQWFFYKVTSEFSLVYAW